MKRTYPLYLTLICLISLACTESKQAPVSKAKNEVAAIPKLSLDDSTAQGLIEQENNASLRVASQGKPSISQRENTDFTFKYKLNEPNSKEKLPKSLLEISALSYDQKRKTLLAVNDELGKIYILDQDGSSIKEKVKFSSRGDYEGIEIVGNTVYILKANGHIYPYDTQSKKTGDHFNTPLSTSNDVEGLGYNKEAHELILACKGKPELSGQSKLKNSKAFYSFDLNKKVLKETPKFIISDAKLKDFLDQNPPASQSKKSEKKLKKRLLDFSPSAIAKHPIDGNFYILSSVGKTLVVCDNHGQIKDVQFLSQKKFAQPEGICFEPDGTLYISNEGKSLLANIMKFNYPTN